MLLGSKNCRRTTVKTEPESETSGSGARLVIDSTPPLQQPNTTATLDRSGNISPSDRPDGSWVHCLPLARETGRAVSRERSPFRCDQCRAVGRGCRLRRTNGSKVARIKSNDPIEICAWKKGTSQSSQTNTHSFTHNPSCFFAGLIK